MPDPEMALNIEKNRVMRVGCAMIASKLTDLVDDLDRLIEASWSARSQGDRALEELRHAIACGRGVINDFETRLESEFEAFNKAVKVEVISRE